MKRIRDALATTPSETTSVSQDAAEAATPTADGEAPDVTEASLINLPPTPPPPSVVEQGQTDASTDTATSEADTVEASAATEEVNKTDTGKYN